MEDVLKRWQVVIKAVTLQTKLVMNRLRHKNGNGTIVTKDDILREAKILSSDYVEDRLIRSGLSLKKRKIPPVKDIPEKGNLTIKTFEQFLNKGEIVDDEFPHTIENTSKVLLCVGEYLEAHHKDLYTDVLKQLNVRSIAEANLKKLFMNVAQEMFAGSITWAKIVSLFAFAGGLAVDCVLVGSPVHVKHAKCWTTEFIETELMEWIDREGGWSAMVDYFMIGNDTWSWQFYWTLCAVICIVFAAIVAATLCT